LRLRFQTVSSIEKHLAIGMPRNFNQPGDHCQAEWIYLPIEFRLL